MSTGGGKFDVDGPVIRTQERQDPIPLLASRMRAMGAPDDVVDDTIRAVRDGRSDLHLAGDSDLAQYVGARLAGTDAGFRAADLARIEQARADQDLWNEAQTKVQGSIPGIIAWVGTDPGKAVLIHEAEQDQAAADGRDFRKTLRLFLSGVHGGLTISDG